MRSFFLFIFIILLFYPQTPIKVLAAGTYSDCNITTVLRMGSKGAEVRCLQGKVGVATDGSFGPLTNAAVKVFQTNNRLTPDGIVGPISRLILNSFLANNGIYPSVINHQGLKPMPMPKITNNSTNASLNPVDLDHFISTVVEVNRKNGKSEQELAVIANILRKTITESKIDYNKEFEKLLVNESQQLGIKSNNTPPHPSIFDRMIKKPLSFLDITSSVAQAATGAGIGFGGKLLAATPCAGSWMLEITPLPPTNVVLLSYIPGTQGFASYNIPFTTNLLGLYVPGGNCSYGPVNITTQGTILPMVGSSPL
ncbi:hypothetical protein A2643_00440 [Candidatus Nomurabacteria bacterium RIFCSPHIGHO2_01_FULL_39_220]|uniref:Peptidoglycan binding-like domain-containing protein n=1 Tax=Candidatus Nomurabacteria bacterium RIFCSPLOWO2_02_FULL_40_67 TaxID=1801787 RepID=A0A1F6Y410_9BACT|nr:MAG: NLP/P60 protein [Parcubacteria group bacterium GW2011_GWA2_40_37]KKS71646.1 MAG: NLP/P60 protein [Parcubacteria group bacterium GW2011_GWF2_42_7]OGI62031.1 MAG: hypothetical protein A2W12_01580 [Candidatus Nomurabacteria bacterium RBG_16_40_11]OGI70244.1 MAG: hypothetical protein A2643_00440 [Candidatus Nomurabacteria bacterium RIFCSPHIGHO2_01_FULL_39_220]OGI73447.1 MAG: hypothetical protein A2W56_02040 [Candidatus Nomurabacteria bacterium RIFCSPHIGHO2_02_41_18]OGI78716.1 MAG: hypothet